MKTKIKTFTILILAIISYILPACAHENLTVSTQNHFIETEKYFMMEEQVYADNDDEGWGQKGCGYLSESGIEKGIDALVEWCPPCKVIQALSSSFMESAAGAMNVSVALGRMLAKYGFLVWLGYYILLQVSSLSPIEPGKMLQEILVMGFKVSLSIGAINYITDVCVKYLVDPLMATGIDYGLAILNGV